ncbi:hypothetical protein ROHU_007126 [Labeo rohita]|uniref:Uncharacterized protein n=1 Tax=Labeo rohita TaxID=84645 RepID=A0A498MNZ4_LABRO|nr:hypothetical protein ROHU_007126 [Labeo rohita]
MASKKGNKTSTLLNSVTKDSSLALDDTQWYHDTITSSPSRAQRMSTTAISPASAKSHGTSHNSQKSQKKGSTGNLTGCAKPIDLLTQEQLVWVSDNKTHISTTQTSKVLSIHKNNAAHHQKTWNKS